MNLSTMVNILNEKFNGNNIRYLEIRDHLPGKAFGSCYIEFELGRKVYRVVWDYSYNPLNLQCNEKRVWSDVSKKPDEWIECQFTRELVSAICSLRFDDWGELIKDD